VIASDDRTLHGWFDRDLPPVLTVEPGTTVRFQTDAMLDVIAALHGVARSDAMALASVVVDLRVTQVANQVFGAHAVLPHGAIEV
jgi:acetamidase/formamidase